MKKGFLILPVLAALVLGGCAERMITEGYEPSRVSELLQFKAPQSAGRIYFLNGILTGYTMNIRHGYPSSLWLSGNLIGSVNKQDVLVADVPAGTYEVYWTSGPNATGPDAIKATKQTVSIMTGEYYVIRANFNVGGTGFGLIGALVNPPSTEILINKDTSDINSLNLVKPISCPATICIKLSNVSAYGTN